MVFTTTFCVLVLVGAASGGGPRVTCTILARDRTFIPIPDEIVGDFVPEAGERKRLEVAMRNPIALCGNRMYGFRRAGRRTRLRSVRVKRLVDGRLCVNLGVVVTRVRSRDC